MRRVHTPLCHFVTSPPQGGRLVTCGAAHFKALQQKLRQSSEARSSRPQSPPLWGRCHESDRGGYLARAYSFAPRILLLTLLPLPALAASKADVEVQFQTWVQEDLWPEAKKDGVSEKTFEAPLPA